MRPRILARRLLAGTLEDTTIRYSDTCVHIRCRDPGARNVILGVYETMLAGSIRRLLHPHSQTPH